MSGDSCLSLTGAVEMLLSDEFKSGEEQLKAAVGVSPRHALLYAQLAFARSVLSMVPADLEDALARCWAADAAMEAQLKASGERPGMIGRMSALLGGGEGEQANAGEGDEGVKLRTEMEGKLVKADAHLMGAVMQLLLGRYLKGAWNLRAGWNLYHAAKQVQEERPEALSAELGCLVDFGIGMLNLVLSLLPATYLSLAQVAGFSGSRETALALLTRSYQSEAYWAPFSALLLLYFYTQLVPNVGLAAPQDGPAVQAILAAPVAVKYKHSSLFLWMQGGAHRISGKSSEATAALKHAEKNAAEMRALQGIIRNDLAWCRLREGEWGGAAEEFGRLLQGYAQEEGGGGPYNAVYAYESAVCLLANDEVDAAEALLAAVETFVPEDGGQGTAGRGEWGPVRYALDMAAALLKGELTKEVGRLACIELLVLWDASATLSPATAAAFLDSLPTEPSFSSPARLQLLQGALRMAVGGTEASAGESMLLEVMQASDDKLASAMPGDADGRHYRAFATYLVGRAKLVAGQVDEGREILKGAMEETECQLQAFLAFKLHANAG